MKSCTLVLIHLLLIGVSFCIAQGASTQLPAFPGAEGFGAATPGGRGGTVIEVTNLNDDGEGSLRAACEASGPRIVVFRVSGTIDLQSTIKVTSPYLTIAGQSAPGGGICLRSEGTTTMTLKTHDVVLRYLRIRPGPGGESDGLAIQTQEAHDIIVDHCSITWGVDESASMYTGDEDEKIKNVTFQWCIISDALDCSTHSEGCHSKGLLLQYCDKLSVHHNLFANNGARNPMILSGEIDVVNNVVYNWGGSAVKIENRHGDVFMNYVKNYLAPGEDSDQSENGIQVKTSGIFMYLNDNLAEHVRPDNSFPEDAIVNYRVAGEPLVATRYDYPSVTTTTASQAYEDVLAYSGATLPTRDAADQRTVQGVRDRTGRIIDDPSEVGGYPALATVPPPADADADGMPDRWEIDNDLDPDDASDASLDANGDGYTNVEEYLNALVEEPQPTTDCHGTVGGSAYRDECGVCVGDSTGLLPCVPVTEIFIDNCPSAPVLPGDSLTLTASLSPSTATNQEVTWASSDPSVATVDSSGKVSTNSVGTVAIVANSVEGSQRDTCVLTVQSAGGDVSRTWQAEEAVLSDGMEVTSIHAGYNGSGFVNFPKDDGYVQFESVDGGQGGTFDLVLRFALSKPSRTGSLFINGQAQDITVTSTGGWKSWSTKTLSVRLEPAANTIRLASTGGDFANLDEITVRRSAAPAEPILKIDSQASRTSVYPNPNRGSFIARLPRKSNVTITTTAGVIVYNAVLDSGSHEIDISYLPTGVYLLNDGVERLRLLVE